MSYAGDLNQDGIVDVFVGSPNTDSPQSPGEALLFFGPLSGFYTGADADAQLIGEHEFDRAGSRIAGGGDVNGDGFPDLVVGAYGNDFKGVEAGKVYVVHGPVEGTLQLGNSDAVLTGEEPEDKAGMGVGFVGDTNGDGNDDIAVGAPHAQEVGNNSGKAYLLRGPLVDGSLANADTVFLLEESSVLVGYSLDGGDFDDDGYADLAIGVPGDVHDTSRPGRVYCFLGPMTGVLLEEQANLYVGESLGDGAGFSLAVGMLNPDNMMDLVIGAPYSDARREKAGNVYMVFGGASL